MIMNGGLNSHTPICWKKYIKITLGPNILPKEFSSFEQFNDEMFYCTNYEKKCYDYQSFNLFILLFIFSYFFVLVYHQFYYSLIPPEYEVNNQIHTTKSITIESFETLSTFLNHKVFSLNHFKYLERKM